jgi:hypothetical protein
MFRFGPRFRRTQASKLTILGATLTLFAQCKETYESINEKGPDYDECAEKILKTQSGYVRFLSGQAGGHDLI